MKSRLKSALAMAVAFVIASSASNYTLAGTVDYNNAVLADNPIYYYTLDDLGVGLKNLGTAGTNGGSNNLAAGGTTSFAASGTTSNGASLGSGIVFGANSDKVKSNGALSGGSFSKYVFEFWFKGSDSTTNQYMFWHGGNNQPAAILGYNDGAFEAFGGSRTGADGPNPANGAWNHVVVGIDSAASHIIYINGVQAPAGTTTETIAAWVTSGTLWIGGSNLGDPLQGSLDEFAVYNVGAGDLAAKTAAVAGHYSVAAGPAPGPLGPQIAPTSYTFNAAPSGSYLDPGMTELTDGIGKGMNVWPNAFDSTPLVGWENVNPSITFNFAAAQSVESVLLYLADSEGSAGVGLPLTVRITTLGGYDETFYIENPAGSGTAAGIRVFGIDALSDNFTLTLARGYSWTMLSEVEFFTAAAVVPTPAAFPGGLAIAVLALVRRRRA